MDTSYSLSFITKSKFLCRLNQHQKMLKTNINSEKYWGFVEHLKQYLKITGLDVELRQIKWMNKIIFLINLEIYFENNSEINYKMLKHIFQLYFYDVHDVIYGQNFMHITMNE